MNMSAGVFIIFAPAICHCLSQLHRLLINKNIMTLFVILAGSTPTAFPIKSVQF